MAITFPASPSDGDVFTNSTTGVKYIYNATDGVWKTHVWPTNTDYLQLSGGTLTGDLSLGTNDLTAQDINSTTLTTTGGVTVGNGLTVSDGNVVMAAGHGIDFSANANAAGMTSELLDDYERGTWTTQLYAGNHFESPISNDPNLTSSYVKIGSTVYFFLYERWNLSNIPTTWNDTRVTLPFASADFRPVTISYWSGFYNTGINSAYHPTGYIDKSQSHLRLTIQAMNQTGESNVGSGEMQTASTSAGLMISGMYTAA